MREIIDDVVKQHRYDTGIEGEITRRAMESPEFSGRIINNFPKFTMHRESYSKKSIAEILTAGQDVQGVSFTDGIITTGNLTYKVNSDVLNKIKVLLVAAIRLDEAYSRDVTMATLEAIKKIPMSGSESDVYVDIYNYVTNLLQQTNTETNGFEKAVNILEGKV